MKRLKCIFLILLLIVLFDWPVFSQDFTAGQHFDRIVIDAGHGGYDSGARGSKSLEKDITLSIALMTGRLINERLPGVEVIYTRTDDRFVELHRRARIANESAADLFISIHCNSNLSHRPFGAETYVMGLHKTQENLEVAKAENAAILMEENYDEQYDGFNPNLDEDYIMLNMFQSANIRQSLDFSLDVQEKLSSVGGLYDRGVRQAGFVVLYLTTMPGALIETGFLSNPSEEEFLLKKKNQQRIAGAIFQAIEDYKQKADAELAATHPSKKTDTAITIEKPKKIYRIAFAGFNKEKDTGSRRFRGMRNLWHFYDGKEYIYTYGLSNSLEGIVEQLKKFRNEDRIKKRYLKKIEILEFEGGKLISGHPIEQD